MRFVVLFLLFPIAAWSGEPCQFGKMAGMGFQIAAMVTGNIHVVISDIKLKPLPDGGATSVCMVYGSGPPPAAGDPVTGIALGEMLTEGNGGISMIEKYLPNLPLGTDYWFDAATTSPLPDPIKASGMVSEYACESRNGWIDRRPGCGK